eukprot:scaffold126661_cov28-Tisochrysis_lutea.AAC.8
MPLPVAWRPPGKSSRSRGSKHATRRWVTAPCVASTSSAEARLDLLRAGLPLPALPSMVQHWWCSQSRSAQPWPMRVRARAARHERGKPREQRAKRGHHLPSACRASPPLVVVARAQRRECPRTIGGTRVRLAVLQAAPRGCARTPRASAGVAESGGPPLQCASAPSRRPQCLQGL